jgi:methylated-DNA-protein-cysteine methyltransferase-like protein
MARGSPFFQRIKRDVLAILAAVPRGRLVTFGDVAAHIDVPARHVGYILATLDPMDAGLVPWYRAVPGDGVVWSSKADSTGLKQRARLVEEGVEIADDGRIVALAQRVVDVELLDHGVPKQRRPRGAPPPQRPMRRGNQPS